MTTRTKPRPTRKPATGADTCEVPCFKEELVEDIRGWLPADAGIKKVATLHGVLADPTRLKVLMALSRDELCVCDVSHVLGLSVSATSHQLRVLRNMGVVSSRNDGRMVYYSLPEDSQVRPWVDQALAAQG